MEEENKKIRLIETQNGVWFKKIGNQKPLPAVPEEVQLWHAAKEEVYEEFGKPREKWSWFGEVAKWTTLLVAAVSFLVFSVDYLYYLGLFGNLGVEELSFISFTSSPVHLMGVVIFIEMTSHILGGVLIARLIFVGFSKLKLEYPRHDGLFNLLTLLSYLIFYAFYAFSFLEKNGAPSRVLLFISSSLITIFLLVIWMDFPKRAGKKGEDQKKREAEKSFLEFAIKFAPLFTIVLLIFLVYLGAPLLQGMELSVNFLTGKTQNPSICINTTSKLDLPEERQQTAAGGSDIYTTCAEPVKLNSGYTVPSLQYLGQGGESIFLYHFPSGGIVVIPKERLLTYTLYNKPDRPENIFLK